MKDDFFVGLAQHFDQTRSKLQMPGGFIESIALGDQAGATTFTGSESFSDTQYCVGPGSACSRLRW